MTEKTRFYLLDGMRGLAAVSVMLFHYTQYNGLNWFKAAPMAVDLFFILSGFVLAHGYGDKIALGMNFRTFLWQRLVRLWPIYIVGLGLGIIAATLQGVPGADIAAAALWGSVVFPYFNHIAWAFEDGAAIGAVFPLNGAAWSLFFEMAVNIAFFAYVSIRRDIRIGRLTLISGIVYALCVVLSGQLNPGWGIDNFWLAFPRVIAEFSMGVWLYTERHRLPQLPNWIAFGLGALVLVLFMVADGRALLVFIFILAPMLILCGSKVAMGSLGAKISSALGDISYPLYILHIPVYQLAYQALSLGHFPPVIRTLGVGVLVLGLSFGLARCDAILRRRLRRARMGSEVQSLP